MESILYDLCKSYSQLNHHFKKLRELDRNITEFNEIFSAFLFGLQLNSECLEIHQLPPVSLGKVSVNEPSKSIVATEKKLEGLSLSLNENNASQANEALTKSALTATSIAGPKKVPAKSKKESTHSIVRKMVQNLPLHMRDAKHSSDIETLVRFMQKKPEGHYVNDIFSGCSIDKHAAMQILNLLVKSGDLLKISRKGLHYQLNPERYVL